jgi:hypothetical protein
VETFEGLQVGQLARNALEGVVVHLTRQPESNNTITHTKKNTHRQGAQRSQEAYLAWEATNAIPRELEDRGQSETSESEVLT